MSKLSKMFPLLLFFLLSCSNATKQQTIEITSKEINGIAHILLNGNQTPPIITAKKGETLKITFENKSNQPATIHWHGVFLENSQDGVPDITQPSIKSGESFTYTFNVKQTGTKWYHSHLLNEDAGLFGALVFTGDEKELNYSQEQVLQFSGLLDKSPEEMLAKLQGNYQTPPQENSHHNMDHSQMGNAPTKNKGMSCDKDTSNGCNIEHSQKIDSNEPQNGHHQHAGGAAHVPMDYVEMLLNGKNENLMIKAKPNEKVRLRIINSFASGEVKISFAGKMDIVASDGNLVQPVGTNSFELSPGETYDVLASIPDDNKYILKATYSEGDISRSITIGSNGEEKLPNIEQTSLFSNGDYSNLLSLTKTNAAKPTREVEITLSQKIGAYEWQMESTDIIDGVLKVKKGDVVRINFKMPQYSESHPMHLHGMDFRLVNGSSEYAPMKNTFKMPPINGGTATIEFIASAKGKWAFHCHNLYHMASGMMAFVEVE